MKARTIAIVAGAGLVGVYVLGRRELKAYRAVAEGAPDGADQFLPIPSATDELKAGWSYVRKKFDQVTSKR